MSLDELLGAARRLVDTGYDPDMLGDAANIVPLSDLAAALP